MKIQKKHIIAGCIGLVTISGALAYLQYKKLMDYVLGFKNLKVKKISADKLNFDVFFNFENKSNVKFSLEKQKYDIYINGIYLTTMQNTAPNVIHPKSTSVLGVNVDIDPKPAFERLKLAAAAILANTGMVKIKIISNMKIKYGLFSFSIPPYTYENTLKNMMAT